MSMLFRKIVFCGIILLPMVVYGLLVVHYTVNIPYLDDYDVFLSYLNTSRAERPDLLFTQHNEHRIVFTRLIAEAMYCLLGYIDFSYLIYLGNAALFFIFLILIYLFKKTGVPASVFLPVPFFLFSVFSWENMTWATAALQNYYVLLFALLALVFFARQRLASFCAAILFGLAAAFTSGAGLLVFIVMALWSGQKILERHKVGGEKADYITRPKTFHLIRLMVVLGIIAVLFYVYFHNYTYPSRHPRVLSALSNPMHTLTYFLVLLGSYIKVRIAAAAAGALTIILFVYITYKRYYQKNPVVYYFLVFIIVNAIGVTLTRSGFGIKHALATSRYIVAYILILVFLYIAVWETIKPSPTSIAKGLYVVLTAACIFNGLSISAGVPHLAKRYHEIIRGFSIWQTCHEIGYYYPNQEQAKMLMDKALAKGYYQIPPEKSLK